MAEVTSYRVFISAVSNELKSYREALAAHLRTQEIEVRDQSHFRQSGKTLLEAISDYIENCDAVICLIGDQCGDLPSAEHMAAVGENASAAQFREYSGVDDISLTQWEFILARSHGKKIFSYITVADFKADAASEETDAKQTLQASYREWVKQTGANRDKLETVEKLLVVVSALRFPTVIKAKPNNLPLSSIGDLFKGRSQFLKDLHSKLNSGEQNATAITTDASLIKPQTLHGLGGIGKTRAAIEYAWRYLDHYSALLFVPAQSPEILKTSLAELSEVLPLSDISSSSDEQRIAAVLQWLAANENWLLILDNVDAELTVSAVKNLLPQLSKGNVVITSRIAQWGASVNALDLGVLKLEDAAEYLLEATQSYRDVSDNDQQLAEQVAEKVGRLALGLEHAAAWINAQATDFSGYLKAWDASEAAILNSFDKGQIDYPHELLVTWTLSVEQLDNDAKALLKLLSWLSPDPLPDTLFSDNENEKGCFARSAALALRKYSLISRLREENQKGFQVHRLVQATTRIQQEQEPDSELLALEDALVILNDAFVGDPQNVDSWPRLEPLAEHVKVLCGYADGHQKVRKEHPTARLLNDLAQLLNAKARMSEAEPLMRRALEIDESSYGESHPRVATQLNNLAQLLSATNRVSEAEPLMRRALEIDESSYGESHPHVAIRLNNLALLLSSTNRVSEAVPFSRRCVEILHAFGQNTGHTHPNFELVFNNYAALLTKSGLSESQIAQQLQPFLT